MDLRPRTIEFVALIAAVLVLVVGCITLYEMPHAEFTRDKILAVVNVVITGLGVASLLFVWAQLRHTATQDKLVAYHSHFQDLPRAEKVNAVYWSMGRLGIERPIWQTPLSVAERDRILADKEPPPRTAEIAIREYLNDFEEFAAAVNVGLVDDDYAYHIESARVLNAYFGFEKLIEHWLLEDQRKATENKGAGVAPSDYYGELKRLAENWKARKTEEVSEAERQRHRKGIPLRL
jgi:hypothetical protein